MRRMTAACGSLIINCPSFKIYPYALKNLVLKPADYSAYNAAVEKANALDRSLYADTTELDEALAVDISGLNILDQDIVDNQTRAIEDALKNLVLKSADYTEYNKAVEQANALDRSLYEDLTALDEALAVDVSGKNITEQAEVDSQTQAILAAIENLVFKPADYTEYNKAVEQAIMFVQAVTNLIIDIQD